MLPAVIGTTKSNNVWITSNNWWLPRLHWGVWCAWSWVSDFVQTLWMDTDQQKIALCTFCALNVKKLILISTIFIQDLSLCLLLKAILYSYLSYGGTCSVCCPEIGGFRSLGGWKQHFYSKINWGHVVCCKEMIHISKNSWWEIPPLQCNITIHY